jgi:hypothetical protein
MGRDNFPGTLNPKHKDSNDQAVSCVLQGNYYGFESGIWVSLNPGLNTAILRLFLYSDVSQMRFDFFCYFVSHESVPVKSNCTPPLAALVLCVNKWPRWFKHSSVIAGCRSFHDLFRVLLCSPRSDTYGDSRHYYCCSLLGRYWGDDSVMDAVLTANCEAVVGWSVVSHTDITPEFRVEAW